MFFGSKFTSLVKLIELQTNDVFISQQYSQQPLGYVEVSRAKAR
jgi:hypothetical protein